MIIWIFITLLLIISTYTYISIREAEKNIKLNKQKNNNDYEALKRRLDVQQEEIVEINFNKWLKENDLEISCISQDIYGFNAYGYRWIYYKGIKIGVETDGINKLNEQLKLVQRGEKINTHSLYGIEWVVDEDVVFNKTKKNNTKKPKKKGAK